MNMNYIQNKRDYIKKISEKINFNKGKTGRGSQYLTSEQINKIKYLMQLHGKYFNKTLLADYLLKGFENIPFNPIDFLKKKHRFVKVDKLISIDTLLNESHL